MFLVQSGSAVARRRSHDVFMVTHGRKRSINTEYASLFFLPSKNSFIVKAGIVTGGLFFSFDFRPVFCNQSVKLNTSKKNIVRCCSLWFVYPTSRCQHCNLPNVAHFMAVLRSLRKRLMVCDTYFWAGFHQCGCEISVCKLQRPITN